MSNYTDKQLQLALAKMLPERLRFDNEYTTYGNPTPRVRWLYDSMKHFERSDLSVYDTEWLHVCWLVEEQLIKDQANAPDMDTNNYGIWTRYITELGKQCDLSYGSRQHATWQQRALALCKVKGIEI